MAHMLTSSDSNSTEPIKILNDAINQKSEVYDDSNSIELHGWAGIAIAILVVGLIFAFSVILIRWLFRNNNLVVRTKSYPYHRPYEQTSKLNNPTIIKSDFNQGISNPMYRV
uniref:Uncharacterized protein n=1 Tax=Acrobeloides nanus TaxID=290746 RepID=A0A914DC99_9BILA